MKWQFSNATLKRAPRNLRGAHLHNWQYLSMRVAAKTAYTSLRIILVYECTANVVYFDGALIQTLYVLMALQKMMCFV